ncbi:electron transfer flavoprotein beta subunit [Puccinia sorghi]|uniref:Electron transfer flavoprotein beta subunit n=1 Tax=Puccinia sorghi TaxID=27349 RepID=A0A0L6VPI6_9BASI|nr:electron transfer flavoprotein beta subunit [Puccinia sorghi]
MRKEAPPTQNAWPCANALDEKYHHAELHPLANANPNLIICGKQFIDGCPSQVGGMLPGVLIRSLAQLISKVDLKGPSNLEQVHIEREIDGGIEKLTAPLPVVLNNLHS